MKRSPLSRKTEMRRGRPLERKSELKRGGWINRRSEDPEKRADLSKRDREKAEWKASLPQFCWVCGLGARPGAIIAVHHIYERSGTSPKRYDKTFNWFLICHGVAGCHTDAWHNTSDAEQLARKLVFDSKHFDLTAWLEMRNPRAMQWVTMAEVEAEMSLFHGGE